MTHPYSDRLQKLMKSFTRLPGIGPKSAERIVLHLLKQDKVQVEELARLIAEAKANNPNLISAAANIDQQKAQRRIVTSEILPQIDGNANAAAIEPFITFFTQKATNLGWLLLALTLVMAVFNFRFWCKYLCPVGALTGLLSQRSFVKIELGETCGGCQICDKICPVEAIHMNLSKQPVIDYPE